MPANKFLTKKQFVICYFSSLCEARSGAISHFDFLIYLIYGSAQAKYAHPELSFKEHQSKCCCSHEENLQLVGIRVKET